MAIRENGEDTMPGIPPRGRRRDILDDGEDVSSCTERELLLRSLNANLAHDHALGLMAADVSALRGSVQTIERRIAPGGDVEQRAQMTSSHALTGAAKTIAAEVLAEFRGPRGGHNNLTQDGVEKAIEDKLRNIKIAAVEESEKNWRKLKFQIMGGVATGLIVAAVTAYAIGHEAGRVSAPVPTAHP